MKKDNLSKSIPDKDLVYIGNFTNKLEADSEEAKEKKLHEKFITSEEDDTLSENWSEDQEEQNEIQNEFIQKDSQVKS